MDIAVKRVGRQPGDIDGLHLVLVGSSVGCAIARLYAQTFPRTVVGLLLLDSSISNSESISIFPNPSAEDFPVGITPEMCIHARKIIHKLYHPMRPTWRVFGGVTFLSFFLSPMRRSSWA
jgi:pimeloyl-ACP methyl ester carboxylesterase